MSLKVYISYGTPEDQVTALRAQALGVVEGFEVYVPPAHTRTSHKLDAASLAALQNSDAFLGILNFSPKASPVCRQERQGALDKKLLMVQLSEYDPVTDSQIAVLSPDGMKDATVIDVRERGQTILRIEEALSRSTLEKPVRDRFEGLITTALGLVWSRPEPVSAR